MVILTQKKLLGEVNKTLESSELFGEKLEVETLVIDSPTSKRYVIQV